MRDLQSRHRLPPGMLGVTALMVLAGVVLHGVLAPSEVPGVALPRIPAPPLGIPETLRRLGVGSVSWFASALLLVPLWWTAQRFPVSQSLVWRPIVSQLAVVLSAIAVTSGAHYLVAYRGSPYAPSFADFLPVALGASAIPILAVAAIVNVREARRRAMAQAVEAERLRANLAESRLAAVTSQLQPHFLFNTLQSISTLIHRDPQAADAMLTRLSDLLRDVLRRSGRTLVPLEDEIRVVTTYLELAAVRFGDRLAVTVAVDDDTRAGMVPVLLLQPLIENALMHGIGPRAEGGRVGISARREHAELVVSVWDDGVGMANNGRREGIGLGATRERLQYSFGEEQQLVMQARAGGGTEVVVRMPWRTSETQSSRTSERSERRSGTQVDLENGSRPSPG